MIVLIPDGIYSLSAPDEVGSILGDVAGAVRGGAISEDPAGASFCGERAVESGRTDVRGADRSVTEWHFKNRLILYRKCS